MEYVKPFVIGGGLITLGKYTSKFVNPSIAPLIGGLPTGVIASFFLDNDKMRKGEYNGSVYSYFVLFFLVYIVGTLALNLAWRTGWTGVAPPVVYQDEDQL